MEFKNGQINAHELPEGTFISCGITRKRLNLISNNARYREDLEKACKIAGYTDKLLVLSRGAKEDKVAIESLLKQNEKAEMFSRMKEKSDEKSRSNIIVCGS